MGTENEFAKDWNTFKQNVIDTHTRSYPESSLDDFILNRADGAFYCWKEARRTEQVGDFKNARVLYLKASESLKQDEKLTEYPQLAKLVAVIKDEYYNFVVHRDPFYREILKHPLVWIKENSGVLQTELYNEFPEIKREDMTYALYFAEREGLIRREKKGRSYLLFFTREKDNNELLLKLEDDEYEIQEKQKNAKEAEKTKKGCLVAFLCFIWLFLLVIAIAIAGPIGAGVIVVSFIVWRIIKKNQRKKQKAAEAAASGGAVTPPTIPENQDQNEEREKTLV